MARENARRRIGLKKSVLFLAAAAAAVPTLIAPLTAAAATFTWDNNGTTAPLGQDGAGTWDTTLQNFTDGVGNFAWNNGNNDTAVFGNTANGGVVTVNAPITVGGIVFNRSGYNLTTSAAATNFITLAGASPTITANANAIINTPIKGSSAININIANTASVGLTGSGTFTNTGGAIFSGGGTLSVGTFMQNGAGTLSGINLVGIGNNQTVSNAFFVTGGTSNQLIANSNGNSTYSGTLTGTGSIGFGHAGAGASGSLLTVSGNFTNFNGTLLFNNLAGNIRINTSTANVSSPGAIWDLTGATGRIYTTQTTGTLKIGALKSDSGGFLQGGTADSTTGITYEVGTLGIDTTYSGVILDGNSSTTVTSISLNRVVNLHKVGGGRLTLAGSPAASQGYNGTTIIDGGTLTLNNSVQTALSQSISVNVGTFSNPGALDVSPIAGGYTIPAGQVIQGAGGKVYGGVNVTNPTGILNPGVNGGSPAGGSLAFNNGLTLNGGTVAFDLSNDPNGSNNDLISVVGGLNLTAPSKLFINPIGTFSTGTYRLFNYDSLPSGTFSNLTAAFGSPITAQLDFSHAGQINLNILSLAAARNIHWNGPGATWDINTSNNFALDSDNSAAGFFQGDNVTFDDNAAPGAPTTVTLAGTLQPGTLHFNNNTLNYTINTINGAGAIGGATGITKDGSGSVSISTANSFTGPVVINAGTLRAANSAALGTNGTITLNGGTLGVDNGASLTQKLKVNANATLSGNGTFASGIFGDTKTLNFDIPSGSTISMKLATTAGIANSGIFQSADDFTGTFNLGTSNGTLRWQDAVPVTADIVLDLGTASATFNPRDDVDTINLSGIAGGPNTKLLGDSNSNTPMNYVIGLFGGSIIPAQSTFAGSIANGAGGSSAAVNLRKQGPSYRLILSGANTYTGITEIDNGTLEVNGAHSGGGTYTINGGTLSGTGVIASRVDTNSGTLAPGSVANPTGALSVATLNMSGANIVFNIGNGGAAKLNVTGNNGILSGTANIALNDIGGSTYGRYTLVDYNGTPLSDLSQFNPNSGFVVAGTTANLVNNTFNTSVDLLVLNPAAKDSTWSGASSNQWQASATGNWTNGQVPGAPDDVATFTNTGAGPVTLTAPRTVALINFNTTNAAAYDLSGSTLTLDASGGYVAVNVFGGTQTISAPVVLGKQTYLAVDTPATLVLSNQVSGSNSVTKSGAGTLVLSGNNMLSGPVTLTSGTLVVSSSNSIGDGSSTNTLGLNGGTLVITGPFNSPATRSVQLLSNITVEHGANNVEIDGIVSGGGKLTSNGAGTLTLAAANTFTGGLTVNNGTAIGLTPQSFGTGSIALNNATMQLPGSQTYSTAISITNGGTIAFTSESQGTFSGVITDNGSNWTVVPGTTNPQTINFTTNTVSSNPTGTVTLANSGTIRLIGTTGVFNISSLTVNIGNSGGFLMNRDGGLGSVQLGGIAGGPAATLRGAGSSGGTTNWHIGYNNVDNTFSGTVSNGTSGALALTKEGTGVLTLSGTLTYTGGTTVVAGGLKVNKLAPGPVAVNAGSLLVMAKGTPNDITGTSVITSAPTIAAGALMDITNNAVIVDYTTLGTQLTDIRANLAAGKLTSSTKLSDQAIGYADASAVGRTTFGGVTLADTTNIVVGVVNTGDANVDGTVNALDFNAVATDFGMTGTGVWQLGDFNYDGNVNTLDFNALAGNFNKILSNAPAPALGSLVPEPASLSAIVLLGLVGRRRRRG